MKKLLLFLILGDIFAFGIPLHAQLSVNTTMPRVNMVKSLEGSGVQFSNITVNCPGVQQIAQFDGTLSNVGLDDGILLTTGSAFTAIGPNTLTGAGENLNTTSGDVDLDSISGVQTFDACVVEFDFETAGDSLNFDFVFASEEYPQFINTINDAFGFFISGPGINGPFDQNAENIALLPDGITPVSIKTINNGTTNAGPCMNCAYYESNGTGSALEPQYTDPTVLQYDGFTKVITARYPVRPCETYHLKLAIADAKDRIQDSGVFLKRGSFKSKTANVVARYKKVYEGCKDNDLFFFKTSAKDSIEVKMQFGGTATNGVDYGILNGGQLEPIPDSIMLQQNQNVQQFHITIPDDATKEGIETIIIRIENSDCFGNFGISDSIIIEIGEELDVDLNIDQTGMQTLCAGDSALISVSVKEKGIWYNWTPQITADTLAQLFTSSFQYSTQVIVTAEDSAGCTGTDTAYVKVLSYPDGAGFTTFQSEILNAKKIQFHPDTMFTSAAKYFWEFNDGSGESSVEMEPIHIFPGPGTYNVALTVKDKFSNHCEFVTDQDIVIGDLEIPNIITPNNDGYNDVLTVPGLFNYKIQLFNRWGISVFKSDNYMNEFDADTIADGTYYYILTTESGATYSSWLQIIR